MNQQVRVTATYTDALGSSENPLSTATSAVVNVNDLGTVILKGSATIGYTLDETVFDNDGLTGVAINYQWQQFFNSIWTNIAGSIAKSLTLTTALLGQQVRVLASYIDNLGSSENVASAGVTVAAQNAIVVENEKTGTTAWQISNLASNNEIAGYGDATSINKGQALNLKISLAQSGQYSIDVYRLGYYGGTGGRLITSVTGLNGVVQASPTITNASTKLVEWNWNTSYTLQTGSDWTTGLYLAKLTDIRTGKQTYVQFVLRDDNRPADIGFQDSVSTTEAYNNYGGYSTYDANSSGGQRAYQVSFDRPLAAANLGLTNTDGFNTNNMLAWEYNMVRWQESQGYDVSYFTNIDTSINPLQLYSQNVFQVTGHDEYWSMDMMNNVTNARDKGINLAFFSANTAYWQVRFEPSSNGQANRVMTVYKDTSGIGTSGDPLDPIAQTDPSAATTLFRSSQVNRPENALMGVGYLSDTSSIYGGYDFVVSNASDAYYANTGLKNGDKLRGLVGYEWDGLLNNGFAPPGLVVLSQSPVQANTVLPPLPSGTNPNISNAVRYTAASGAKVFSTGSVQWVWGLDSDNVIDPRVDIRAWQITVNVLKDMGAKPKTPSSGIVV
ncbi:MAG: Ig domain-containing protein group 1 domain-containing protein [Anabaena sp. 49633_E8]|nr:Ig domain-containing protein group 1 domain-containing protein [Anabaena sp. 49633_E8]